MIKKFIFNFLISIDQLLNTVFGGDPDETISSRLGKRSDSNLLRKIVDWLFFWQKDHTKNSIEPDEGKESL